MGGAWFDGMEFVFAEDGRLKDVLASFGGGVSIDFGPMPMNFYISQHFNGKEFIGRPRFDFYIGPRF
jgi:hypothetical protein